jgi:hypothetical protein
VENLINDRYLQLNDLTTDFSVDDFEELKSLLNYNDVSEINIKGIELLFSYLFITGYLTITTEPNMYSIPNNEIKSVFKKKICDYYKVILSISVEDLIELTLTMNNVFSEEDINELPSIFVNRFAPNLSFLISKLKLYDGKNDKEVDEGFYANEDLMHSLLNYVAMQINGAKFATERYTKKTSGKSGRADIVIQKNNVGIVIEMKRNAKDVKEALEQAEQYIELVKNVDTKIFMGCCITVEKDVFISGEIRSGDTRVRFGYPP